MAGKPQKDHNCKRGWEVTRMESKIGWEAVGTYIYIIYYNIIYVV